MGLGRSVLFGLATSERLERAAKRVPGGERAAWRAASRYVAGRSRSDALATIEMLLERGHGVSVDLFGERVSDPAVADHVLEDYLALVAALPPPPADIWLSVDLSHLALGTGASAAADRLAAIADALHVGRCVQVGAEEAALADPSKPASSPSPQAASPIGLEPPCRRISCARPPTPTRWPTPACTSGSSKAPTSRPPAPTDTASRPTSPSCASASGSPSAARRGRWQPTTAACERRCSSRAGL
jgi:hypothetical protein